MRESVLRPATWVIALIAVTSLGAHRLAAWDWGVFSSTGADQPPPFTEEQGAAPATPDQEKPEVLNRGPIHEAFAQPVNLQLQANLVAPERPPPSIQEIPPAERPRGEQFVWIPGYWSWNVDRTDYMWVSACWRVAPPGMSWVPGYWSTVFGGWKWVAGFWVPAGVREIEYLPAPPVIDDGEPHGSPPSSEATIWVPPCMCWVEGHYVRRDGYWLAGQSNWIWMPSHYVVTPRGCIFVEGYWDYSLEYRGVLFAPVYFPASVRERSDFTYSPSIVVDMRLLRVNLFTYPHYSHYYFGDYYDDAYVSLGIYPRFDSHRRHTWHDPIYEHDCWRNQRSGARWEEGERGEYNRRRANSEFRPARTYNEQKSQLARLSELNRRDFQVTEPLAVAIARGENPLKFERIDTDVRESIYTQSTAVRTFRDKRKRWETLMVAPRRAQPPRERGDTGEAPAENREVIVPTAPREPAFVPPRVPGMPQPERVRIPVSPVVGGSDAPGIFRRGPPSRPGDEDRGKRDKELR